MDGIYFDMTRAFIERVRGPSRAAGMGRVVHEWGRALSPDGGTLVTGLPAKWVSRVLDIEPGFGWMRGIQCGLSAPLASVAERSLMTSAYRPGLAWKALRASGFRMAAGIAAKGVKDILNRQAGSGRKFIYHLPLPEPLPVNLPAECIPLVNIYDIMPIVFTDTYSDRERRTFRRTIESIRRSRAHVVVNSSDTRHSLVCFFDLDPARIHVVPLGSDGTDVSSAGASVQGNRDGRSPYALHVAGSSQRRKNVAASIEGFAHFRQNTGVLAELLVVGGGTETYQSLGDKVAGPGSIHCLGQVDAQSLNNLYAGAHVGLYPSLYEGFGLPILEFMHRGIPVVCGNNTSMPEVAAGAGVLVDATDPRSIGRGIEEVWMTGPLRDKAIETGRERARKITWQASATRLKEVYASILALE